VWPSLIDLNLQLQMTLNLRGFSSGVSYLVEWIPFSGRTGLDWTHWSVRKSRFVPWGSVPASEAQASRICQVAEKCGVTLQGFTTPPVSTVLTWVCAHCQNL
jgi:hypothetical protein